MGKDEELARIEKVNPLALGFMLLTSSVGSVAMGYISNNPLMSAILIFGSYNNYLAYKNSPKASDKKYISFEDYFNDTVYKKENSDILKLYFEREDALKGESLFNRSMIHLGHFSEDFFVNNPEDMTLVEHKNNALSLGLKPTVKKVLKIFKIPSAVKGALADAKENILSLMEQEGPDINPIERFYPDKNNNFDIGIQRYKMNTDKTQKEESLSSYPIDFESYSEEVKDLMDILIDSSSFSPIKGREAAYKKNLNSNNDLSLKNDILNIGYEDSFLMQDKFLDNEAIENLSESYNLIKESIKTGVDIQEAYSNLKDSLTSNSSAIDNFFSFNEGRDSSCVIDISTQ